mmetsp:Transcript_1505/g.1991  ORF Transcript_1505/g.1991 Transcript_1505/m.1991 type:complete len:402 (+) Transcript_1505:3-1208(+)
MTDHSQNSLLKDVMPFWVDHSPDHKHGGYFTCLDTKGNVFDTDKFIWLQAREVWMLSKFYNVLSEDVLNAKGLNGKETRQKWLDLAKLGADFLREHGYDKSTGYFYFSLRRDGVPLVAPYNIFSDCFAAMAFAQYYKATNLEWAKELSLKTFENIQIRKSNPKGQWTKAMPGSRALKSLSIPMIDINLCIEMSEAISGLDVEQRIQENIHLVMDTFLDEQGFFHENVPENPENPGEFSDSFDTRLVNPGHSIEALWFIMNAAAQRGMKDLVKKAADCIVATIEYGWDKEHGGIFYFLDKDGKPPQQLEWDQKLWWVHAETLVALSLAFQLTKEEKFAKWYKIIHEYTWSHFPDPTNGEWFGFLNRRGEVLLQLKGGKWKGCFHVPRCLYLCATIFDEIKKM